MSEPAYVTEPDPPIDLSKISISGIGPNPYIETFAEDGLRLVRTVPAPKLCPRWNFQAPRNPKCNKPLQDYKCPQHGLIREAMPK